MIKKYSKLFVLFLCAFFVGITPSFAREMTLDELEEELKEISPRASYIYVIGEYAFSSTHTFTREDSMLAARSISVVDKDGKTNEDPIYDEMTAFHYDRTVGADGRPNGLKYTTNLFGKTKAPEKLNIKYIDYKYIPEVSNAEVNPADESAYNELGINFRNDSKITAKNEKRNVLLKGVISPNDTIDETIFSKEELTGFYYAFTVDGLTDESVVTVESIKKNVFTKDDFKNGRLVVLTPLEKGRDSVKVTVDLDGDKTTYGNTVYTIDYSELVFEGATTSLLTENDEIYNVATVKDFLTKIKFDFSKTANLKLENGKLTGAISYNGEIGKEFSSNLKDITGYYFTYVLTLDGELTDESIITIPGDGGRKVVRKENFDSGNSIAITTSINPLNPDKVIEIVVDLDGDGDKYSPRTYTIDYSGVDFEKINVSSEDDFLAAMKLTDDLVLNANVELTNQLVLPADSTLSIDLNGKELTVNSQILSSGDLTISNGKIIANKDAIKAEEGSLTLNDVEVLANDYGIRASNGADVTIIGGKVVSTNSTGIALFTDAVAELDGVTVEGKIGGIGANATKPFERLEVKNSTIKSTGEPAIFFPGSSISGKTPELIIDNSELEGISGIDARSGEISISNSTITALGTDSDWEYVKNHDTASGTTDGAAALYLHSQSPYGTTGLLSVDIINTTLVNKNNTKGVIRIYEHGAVGVSNVVVTSDVFYQITEELRDDSKVTVTVNMPSEN